jgi:hypothetical protein
MSMSNEWDPGVLQLLRERGVSIETLDMIRAYVHARDRVADVDLLTAPIADFEANRSLLLEFMHLDVMLHETYRWSDADAVLGIPWPTQIRLLFSNRVTHSPLFAWLEYDQDEFEQDVRTGMGYEKLASLHRLPTSQARTLWRAFRGFSN